jgi:hypothetical protein
MTEKKHKELQDLLKEGASALVSVRKGLQNACAELRTVYGRAVSGDFPGRQVNIGKRQKFPVKP